MRDSITFYFLCEGTSDEALSDHIETLISRQGVPEVVGISRASGGSVHEKLKALRDEGTPFDMVVVHRDADSHDPGARIDEVRRALTELGIHGCPLVPVHMTEAWLLVDELAIRSAVGRPSGSESLELPKLHEIERRSDPKAILKSAILTASGTAGRRRKQANTRWSGYRRTLLERLDIDGSVTRLPSWQRFTADLERAVVALCAGDTTAVTATKPTTR